MPGPTATGALSGVPRPGPIGTSAGPSINDGRTSAHSWPGTRICQRRAPAIACVSSSTSLRRKAS